jgi:serine/threonine protein kinase
MQYVEGDHLGTLLRHVIEEKRRIAPRVVLRIALDALAGLSAAHALRDDDGQPLGLVHRDISPHNILVGTDGLARLTDFGIAKTEGRLHATRSNVVKGKLAYMSPEQLSGKPLDQRADVFAMGIVIWEALTHRRLFAADDPAEIFRRVLRAPAPPPSSVHRALQPLDAVLAKALAKNRGAAGRGPVPREARRGAQARRERAPSASHGLGVRR